MNQKTKFESLLNEGMKYPFLDISSGRGQAIYNP
jgi:hypothetical protein